MAKNNITQFDATAANNTDIQSVDIDEGCAPSGINNAIRELMADLKDVDAGTVALTSPDFTAFKVGGVSVTATAAELNILQDIVTSSGADLDLAPTGTGRVVVKGNTNQGSIVLNCENNSHGITIQSAPHSAGATYVVKLPDALGTTSASAFVTTDANGVATFDNGTIEESTSVTSSSNAATLNLRDGNVFEHTLTENVTYTFSNPAASGKVSSFVLKIKQDASASGYTVTFPASVDFVGGTAPTLTATANAIDTFVIFTTDGGTIYNLLVAGQDIK